MFLRPQLIISGLQSGAVYALVGLGFAIIQNSTGLLNFAQGEFLMVGALCLAVLFTSWSLWYFLSVPLSLAAVIFVALACYFLLIRPLRRKNASVFSMIMVLVGAMTVLEQGAGAVFGKLELPVNSPFSKTPVEIGADSFVLPQTIYLLVGTAAIFGLVYLFYNYTNLGKQMYAVGVDIAAARAIGINVERANVVAFALGGLVAAMAGILLAPLVGAHWLMGLPLTVKGFAAMVVGGGSRLEGPLVGGILLGLVEVLAFTWVSTSYGSALALIMLPVVLLIRPSGLLG